MPLRPALAAAPLLLALVSAAAGAAEVGTQIEEAPLAEGQTVAIKLPLGRVLVEDAPSAGLQATLVVECGERSEKCRQQAERARLVLGESNGRAAVNVEGLARGAIRGLTVSLHVAVPAAHPVEVDLGVGDVRLRGRAGSVEVDLGVGDVEVEAAQEVLRSVELDAGVGSARLVTDVGEILGSGIVGGALAWSQDRGSGRVEVDVGVGDVVVTLR